MVIYSSKKSAVTSLSELSLDVTDKCFQINITRSRFCFPIWLALYHSPLILINQTSVSTNSSVWPGSMLGCQAYNYVFIIPNATTRFIFFFSTVLLWYIIIDCMGYSTSSISSSFAERTPRRKGQQNKMLHMVKC